MSEGMQWRIRPYRDQDLATLAEVYAGAVRHLGPQCYSAEQVAAWSDFAAEEEAFAAWITGARVFVAVDGTEACVGFGGIEEAGHISALFVAPGFQRRGVASGLLSCLLEVAKARGDTLLTTEASAFSRPLFEKFGFHVTEVEHTSRKGVAFSRYRMARPP